jgi:hypothetical protein
MEGKMTENFEYYVIGTILNDKDYPQLDYLSDSITEQYIFFNQVKVIQNPQVMEFSLKKPYPDNPATIDHFSCMESIFSEKIKNVLESFKIKDIQFIPAVIKNGKCKEYNKFYFMHIYRHIKALDWKASKFGNEDGMFTIERYALDHTVLGNIPMEERLVFRLSENASMRIYHKTIVDEIMAKSPKGIEFIKIEEY